MSHFHRWRQLLLSTCCLLLTACAPLHHKVLSAEAKSRIREVHVQVVVPQESFIFSASSPNVSAALGGGLIPALIDASVQKSRQEGMRAQIEPLLDQLLDADFRAEAQMALPQALAGFPLKVGRAEVVAIAPTRADQEALAKRKPVHEGYLVLMMHYTLDANTRALTTRCAARLWEPGQPGPSFGGSAIYQGMPLPAGADLVAMVRGQMREAVAHTLKLVALDMAQPQESGNRPRQPFVFHTAGQPVTMQGEVLASEQRRSLVRSSDGAMFSVAR